MRKRNELEFIKNFLDNSYNRLGLTLLVNTEKLYDPEHTSLGYCFKYTDPVSGNVRYVIECSRIGIERTDFRIMMHEYGHIYKRHLDGDHEYLDTLICNAFRDNRPEILEVIMQGTGLTMEEADKFIDRIIDDPELNHSIHNIAMDMEVNASVLSLDDIREMEMDITSILPKREEEMLEEAMKGCEDEALKQKIQERLNQISAQAKIKLIHPTDYYMGLDENGNPVPFPDDLTYADYLLLIMKHLDQVVKMMVSIQMGDGNNTSGVTQSDIQAALNGILNQMRKRFQQNKSAAYQAGYKQAIQDKRNKGSQQNQSQEYQDGFNDGFKDKVSESLGSEDYNKGKEDGQTDKTNNQGKSQDYKDGFEQGRKDCMDNNSQQSSSIDDKSQDYKDGYQAGQDTQSSRNQNQPGDKQDYQNGYESGNKSNEGLDQTQQENYQSGYQDGQNAAERAMNQQGGNQQQNGGESPSNGSQQQDGQQQGGQQSGGSGNQQQDMNDYQQGYQDAMSDMQNGNNSGGSAAQGLSNLMRSMGLTSQDNQYDQDNGLSDCGDGEGGSRIHDKMDPGQKKGEGQAQKDEVSKYSELGRCQDFGKDGNSDTRREADQRRKEGKIKAGGGTGCGKSGAADIVREVNKEVDEVDMALGEVINNFKNKVVKRSFQRDQLKLHNRGVVRGNVLIPSILSKVSLSTNPKVVFLIDISGSMNTSLVDRILKTISRCMNKINRDLRYDIISWNTRLGEHIKDINPRKGVPKISCGGGTDLAGGIEFFRDNYGKESILVIISDFEDNLDLWHEQEKKMSGYSIWGFNYGSSRYSQKSGNWEWSNLKQRNFSSYGYDD